MQRPPFSVGVFSLADMAAVLEWGLDGYFRHYKLYMYAFTDRCVRVCAHTGGRTRSELCVRNCMGEDAPAVRREGWRRVAGAK